MPVWPKVTVQNPAIDGYAFPCSTGRGSKAEVLGEKLLQLAVDGSDNLPAVRLALRADLSVWGQSNLLASVPAGRVPFSDASGLVTSNAGLTFDAGTGLTVSGRTTLTSSNGGANTSYLTPFLLSSIGHIGTFNWDTSHYGSNIATGGIRIVNRWGSGRSFDTNVFIGGGGNQIDMVSGYKLRWSNAVNTLATMDTEAVRSSAGFVGLGSPTNKVSVGHNGTAGWISTAAGHLILAPWTGQVWLGNVGGAGMRSSLEMGLAENASLNWTNLTNNFFNATIDARIRRSSVNTLDVDTGTNGAFADLRLRNLTASGVIGTAGSASGSDLIPLQITNTSTTSGSGVGIDFVGWNANAGALRTFGRLSFRGNGGSNQHGMLAVNLQSNGTLTSSLLTLDVNGLLTTGAVQATLFIRAQGANSIGIEWGSGTAVTHGWHASNHLDMHGRASNTTALVLSWDSRFGVGFTSRTSPFAVSGRLHANSRAASEPILVTSGAASQTGSALEMRGLSSTNADRPQSGINADWADSTDASRTGRLTLHAYNVASTQEGLRVEANSGGVRLGFYGATAVARQTVSAAATDPATTMALVNELRADLIALGLLQ